jgi:hypothetical protein
MSDTDRLADYLRRMEGDDSPRNLETGCHGCGLSVLACNAKRYVDSLTCCLPCSH